MIYFIGNQPLLLDNNDIYQVSTIEKCLEYFKDKSIIQVDTETEGGKNSIPNPHTHKVLCLQLGDSNNQFVIDTSIYSISLFKSILEDKSKIKIFTNAFFDLRFLFHYGIFSENIYDCFLAEMLLTLGKDLEKGYRSLESMANRYCNIKLNKEIRGQIHYRGVNDSTVIKYAAEDVTFMEKIMNCQLKLLEKDNLLNAIKLENSFIRPLAYISYKGFKVDPEKWLEVDKSNREKLKSIHEELNQWVIKNNHKEFTAAGISGLLFEEFNNCIINWKSAKQTIPLFKKLGINLTVKDKKTSKDKDSVDIKSLKRQIEKSSILPTYIRYKELEKEISTYGEDFIKDNLNKVTKRIHSEFFPLADTGRVNSSNPNLSNIPSTDEFGEMHPLRKCFICEEGNNLIISDFSQQEPFDKGLIIN